MFKETTTFKKGFIKLQKKLKRLDYLEKFNILKLSTFNFLQF